MNEQDGQNGFSLHQQISLNEKRRRELFASNINLLRKMKDTGLYKAVLGDEKGEWAGYLGQIEVFYSRNEVYNWMRIFDKFVTELGFNIPDICDIPTSRLIELLTVINKENCQTLVDQARVLTNRDFTDEIRSIKGLPTIDDGHIHQLVTYEICAICGEKHKKEDHESNM